KASDYSLPGWKSYAQFFGDSAESRTLFVKIQQHESELMGAIDGGPAVASEALGIRVQELQALARTNSPINEGSFAAVLFAARSDKVQVSPQTASLIYSLCHHRSAQTAFSRGANRKAMRQLLGQWIAKGEDWAAYQGMTLAMRFGLKAGLEPATRSLSNAATQTHIQQYALLTIAKLGDRSHLPLLESMLDRKDQCSARRVRTNNMLVEYKTELRDIALACILRVLDKNERAFGFKNADRNEQYVYNTTSLGFSSNEERERVFAKWAELKKELDKKASEEQAGDEKEGAEKKAGEQQSSDDSP
ncbi:MAG: hypothetical protein QGG36_31705, partial [Pirellulaceae bacterium]|nr:hypothetical protein [Pirellulaceae bacterium]